MTGPRDSAQGGAPINSLTGEPLTTGQQMRLAKLTECADALYAAMHEAEGSTGPASKFEDHVFMSRRMNIAATHLETSLMYARKAALEAP